MHFKSKKFGMEALYTTLFRIPFYIQMNTALLVFTSSFGSDGFNDISPNHYISPNTKFLIYDVDPGEGFNFRRDVYVRVANLIKKMNDMGGDWILVLPPWRHLDHWKSRYVKQEGIKWETFFELRHMGTYVPVMEFEDFTHKQGFNIEHILHLQRTIYSPERGEIFEFSETCEHQMYHKSNDDGYFRGYFWGMEKVYAIKHDCVNTQGNCMLLIDFLKKIDARSVFLPNIEECHLKSDDMEYYKARRSLVLDKYLRQEADKFRVRFLNSSDENDKTIYNEDWREQIPEVGSAIGGPYLGIHVRRQDFGMYVHQNIIPSIDEIVVEVTKMIGKYNLTRIYLSTDADDNEVMQLQTRFPVKTFRFPRSNDVIDGYKDGGIAIIEQWIVAHARYFIGSCMSTFSLRIYEERDILGFHPDTTYNCICGQQSPTNWCDSNVTRKRVKFK